MRPAMWSTTFRFLPRRPLSSNSCSTTLRRRATSTDWITEASSSNSRRTCSRTSVCCCGTSSSDSARSSSGRRLRRSSGVSPWILATRPFCADTGKTRDAAARASRPTDDTWLRDLDLDLHVVAQFVPQTVDLVQHDEAARRVRRADVIAPDLDVGARHPGVGREHEQHRVGAGDQVQRQFGLDADARSGPGCRSRPAPSRAADRGC